MDKTSIQKLLDAGYILLRATQDGGSKNDQQRIKYSDTYGVWRTLEVFGLKAYNHERREETGRHDDGGATRRV